MADETLDDSLRLAIPLTVIKIQERSAPAIRRCTYTGPRALVCGKIAYVCQILPALENSVESADKSHCYQTMISVEQTFTQMTKYERLNS